MPLSTLVCEPYGSGKVLSKRSQSPLMSPNEPSTIVTRLASMALVKPGFVEQRYFDDARLDLIGFAENKTARLRLADGKPHVMISWMPPGIDFDVKVTSVDHFSAERGQDTIQALAVVANDRIAEMTTRLFFSYFPPHFPFRVFDSERTDEARMWIEDRWKELPVVV